MSIHDVFFDTTTYPKLVTFSRRIKAGYDEYETRVEISEGVFEKLTKEWENHPKFKEYFDCMNKKGQEICDFINKEIIREIYEQHGKN